MTNQPYTMLLVEDEDAHIEAITRSMSGVSRQNKIIALKNAGEFRKAVADNRAFDLILLDMNLPDGNAIDLMTELEIGSRWPVIIMTAFGDEELAVRAIKSGAIDYIVKSEGTFRDIGKTAEHTLREWENIQKGKKAEMALFESEERFRKLIELSPISIIIGRDGKVEYVNKAFSKMIGAGEKEIRGKDYISFIAPEERERLQEYSIACAQGKSVPTVYETLGLRADGVRVPIEINVSSIMLESGPESIAYVADLTERRKAEDALRESEERYRATVNSMDVFLHVVDRDFRIILYNEVLVGMMKELGFHEEMKGKSLFDVFTFVPENTKSIYRNILKTGEKFTDEQSIKVDERIVWCETRRIPIRDADGQVAGIITIIIDITERKTMENALRESEARNKALLEAIPDMMFVISETGEILDYKAVNQSDLYASPERFLGKNVRETLPPDVAELTIERINAIKGRGGIETYEYSLQMNGLEYFESRLVPYGDNKYIGIIRNITERKRAEAERIEMERRLQHVQKLESLGVLAGGIAHDFNNILTAILGHSELALFGLDPFNPARDSIREIENASHRAAELCRQMLAYSGKGKFVIEDINLSTLINEMVSFLKAAVSKKAVLNMNLENDIAGIKGDATQIRQVVMNLITNASDALEGNHGVITIADGTIDCDKETLSKYSFGAELSEGLYVYLEVTDTGTGMDEETMVHIFEPFFTTKFTGRGLGMSAVMGIVRGHNGAISIDSETGKGSTFRIIFPSIDKSMIVDENIPETSPAIKKGMGLVMVVDDEEIVRSTTKLMLEKLEFEALTASGGHEAIRLFREKRDKIRIVIIDLNMPQIDGEETLNELRKIDPAVRTIIASGYSESELNMRFLNRENLNYIQKPFSLSELSEILKSTG
ncbi:MAG: PAS domain S-box protein [Brevinematales bacterium]|nr:PAS domain S-box protein [Brevinematales bacterium]